MAKHSGHNYFHIPINSDGNANVPAGEKINLSATSFTPDPIKGSNFIKRMSWYKGALGYITYWQDDGNWTTVEGTATLVGPATAITAFHVIDGLEERLSSGELRIAVICPTAAGGIAWHVSQVSRVGKFDLAMLSLRLGTPLKAPYRASHFALNANVPSVGKRVMVAGFRAVTSVIPGAEYPYFPFENKTAQHGLDLWRSVGDVVYVDREMLRVQFDAPTEGGMSGGVALDEHGTCFGILSKSISFADGHGVSTVHSLWPALATPMPNSIFANEEVDLLNLPAVHISGRERLVVERPFPTVTRVTLKTAIET